MNLIDQSVQTIFPQTRDAALHELRTVEAAARNCYHSGDKMTDDSWEKFIHSLMTRKHESPLEFAKFTVLITTSRDVLAELTRHRLCSFAVESQRYVLASKDGDIRFVKPADYDEEKYKSWKTELESIEKTYKDMIAQGAKPEDARKILPNSTACTIYMTANLREWLHIFELRLSPRAYPEMRQLMRLIYNEFNNAYPGLIVENNNAE